MSGYPYDDETTLTAEQQQELQSLMADGLAHRLSTWQQKAAERFPEVSHLTSLIQAADENGVMSMAREMAERMRNAGQQPAESPQPQQQQRRESLPSTPAASPSMEGYGQQVEGEENARLIRRMQANPYGRDSDGVSLMKKLLDAKFAAAEGQ